VLLSAVAGYVDAAGFASLIGLFPAHLTGELVGDAIAFSSGHPRDHRTHLWMLPVFVGSVVVASLTARILRRNGLRPLAGLLALVTVALALFSVSDELAQLLHVALRTRMLVGGGCAVAAMGVQNALMRESLKTSCPTTVMTGNLTQVVIDLADRAFAKLLPPSKYDRRPRSRLGPVSAALGAFLICALLGAWLTRMCGSSSVAVPTLMTALMTVWAWREDRVRAAQAAPVAAFASARVPSFEPAQVWPDSLMPASEPVSVSQVRAAPGVPPLPEAQNSSSRLIAEKRTVSGTRLAQRLRDDK
jgi:uncharacterized membrane protein YoaK (UPF0700 family)